MHFGLLWTFNGLLKNDSSFFRWKSGFFFNWSCIVLIDYMSLVDNWICDELNVGPFGIPYNDFVKWICIFFWIECGIQFFFLVPLLNFNSMGIELISPCDHPFSSEFCKAPSTPKDILCSEHWRNFLCLGWITFKDKTMFRTLKIFGTLKISLDEDAAEESTNFYNLIGRE